MKKDWLDDVMYLAPLWAPTVGLLGILGALVFLVSLQPDDCPPPHQWGTDTETKELRGE